MWKDHQRRGTRPSSISRDRDSAAIRFPRRLRRWLRSATTLKLMWAYIFVISLYDIWLVIAVKDVILATEENPVCLWLIQYDPHYLSLFIPAKIAGTLFVIAVCNRLARFWRDGAAGVTSGLAGFQSGLLVYLTV